MKIINIYPKNKEKFIQLIDFCRKILNICKKLKIKPLAYGSLAIFAYTKNKEISVNDIDFLISEANFKKIISELIKKKIKYKYSIKWHVLQILKDSLKIEMDSIEFWQKDLSNNFNDFNINGLNIKVISLNNLINIYKKLSKISKKNPEEKHKKYLMLQKIK